MEEARKKTTTKQKTLDMVFITMLAALMAVCSWITIPAAIPFTLQTFGVFCAVGLLGGKRGALSIIVYILLGAFGLPVFAGFNSGFGVIFGLTGGYIIGFIFSSLVYWLITKLLGTKTWSMVFGMVSGLLVCYLFGTVWFMAAYARTTGAIGFVSALGMCVFPFIIPDILKIALAVFIAKKVPQYIKYL